jgi:hypothetical protein
MSGKIFGFKGSLLPYVNMIGLFLILAALAMIGGLDWYFVVGMGIFYILLLIGGGYLESKSKHRIDKLWDERKARYDTLAARNGYVFAMVAIGVLSMFYALGQSQVTMLLALMDTYVLITLVQFISYTYYLGRDTE